MTACRPVLRHCWKAIPSVNYEAFPICPCRPRHATGSCVNRHGISPPHVVCPEAQRSPMPELRGSAEQPSDSVQALHSGPLPPRQAAAKKEQVPNAKGEAAGKGDLSAIGVREKDQVAQTRLRPRRFTREPEGSLGITLRRLSKEPPHWRRCRWPSATAGRF